MKYIGLDVGNGTIGMGIKTEEGTITYDTFPSVYGLFDRTAQNIHLSVSKKKQVKVFSLDGRDYVLGYEGVINTGSTPISAYDREERIHRKEFQILTKLSLLDAATKDEVDGVIEVSLSLGTPVEDYRDEQLAEIRRWFEAPVSGTVNGKQVVVMVKRLEIVSQPISVLMDAYLDNDGFIADETIENEKILVLDSGSGTLDMTEFDKMTLVKQSSGAIGMNDVYQNMITEIKRREPKARVDAFDLERQLREQDGHEKYQFSYGRISLDISEIRSNAMNVTWERMVGIITREYPDRLKFHRVLLAGGTGEAFKSYFGAWMPTITLSDDSQLAIARGLLKYLLANVAQSEAIEEAGIASE